MNPLLVFDTNILADIWLGRDGNQAVLLLGLAEAGVVDLVIPEYVLIEFRGFGLRWIRDERAKLNAHLRPLVNAWGRCEELDGGADTLRQGAREVEEQLDHLQAIVEPTIERVRAVAEVPPHTLELHFRGDLRFLSGQPPDRPTDGIKDCRIFEAVLDVARGDAVNQRRKYLVTRDGDFDHEDIREELAQLGFELHRQPGQLYGELRPEP